MRINIDGEALEAAEFSTEWPARVYAGEQLGIRLGSAPQIKVDIDADLSVRGGYVLKRQGRVVGVLVLSQEHTK